MDLPVRILDKPGTEPVISVDGAWRAPGLNLSHWPGNTTPVELKHDLSTGIAFNFIRLPEARRAALATGCVAIANNHYDTDGLCALFTVRHEDRALPREASLLAAARCGDFYQVPSEEAFVVDAIVGGLADPERSPFAQDLRGLEDRERHERATNLALDVFAGILDGEVEPYRSLWEEPLATLRSDLLDLENLAPGGRDDIVHFDFTVWTAPAGTSSSRGAASFDPGRHALFGSTSSDRVLVLGPGPAGTTVRFVVGTLSWFDLVTEKRQKRPDLKALTAELNELEGTRKGEEVAWRHHVGSASPELWFGTRAFAKFSEHAHDVLRPSALDPTVVKARILDGLRAVWTFPEEEIEAAPWPS